MNVRAASSIVILTRQGRLQPAAPESSVLGRAALAANEEGIETLFGWPTGSREAAGLRAIPGGWEPAASAISAVYDRFPSQSWPEQWAAALALLERGVPVGNPPALTRLCRDKLACQRVLEQAGIPMPEVTADPTSYPAALASWGTAFLKPRHGALGRGVRVVRPGDPLPARGPGARRGHEDDYLLQRAVLPPLGWTALALRVLVQRLPRGGWTARPGVARISQSDPVANVDRGAKAIPAEEVLDPSTSARATELALEAAQVLTQQPGCETAAELGIDLVLDQSGVPQVIEANGRPIGRLKNLHEERGGAWAKQHLEAVLAPLRYLASL